MKSACALSCVRLAAGANDWRGDLQCRKGLGLAFSNASPRCSRHQWESVASIGRWIRLHTSPRSRRSGTLKYLAVSADKDRPDALKSAAVRPIRRRHRHRHDVLRGFDQRDVEQCRQAATRANLRRRSTTYRPAVVGSSAMPNCRRYMSQMSCFSDSARQIQEEHRVEPFRAGELRRQLADVVRGADEEHVGLDARRAR